MTSTRDPDRPTPGQSSVPRPVWWALAIGFLFIVLTALLLPRAKTSNNPATDDGSDITKANSASTTSGTGGRAGSPRRSSSGAPGLSAEQIVSNKVSQFARSRRDILHQMAQQRGGKVPAEFEEIVDAIE